MKATRRLLFAARRRTSNSLHRNAGFTIIEVLIVLAAAGLILIIVFEAVPALERSGRNNQRRQDVQTILEAVSHYELNDSGKFPDNCGTLPHACTVPGGSTPNDYFLRFVSTKLTFYTGATQVVAKHLTSDPAAPGYAASEGPITAPSKVNKVYVYNYQLCSQTGGGSTAQGAGYSDVVALYAIETGSSGYTPQCQQL